MPKFLYTNIYEIEARGGLSPDVINAVPQLKNNGYSATRSGRFTILSIAKHISGSRWNWSAIPWGAPVRMDIDAVYVKLNNKWRKLSSTHPAWLANYKKDPNPEQRLLTELEMRYSAVDPNSGFSYRKMYGGKDLDSWIFNDFGHVSIKYFRDANNNGRFDQGSDEMISDFVHTTPDSEAQTEYSRTHPTGIAPVIPLTYSHGCIHVKPTDIDMLVARGYAVRGAIIEIHPYSDVVTATQSFDRPYGRPPHELHFLPGRNRTKVEEEDGRGKLVVYKVTKIS